MTAFRLLLGFLALLILVGPLVLGASSVRRRLLRASTGFDGALVDLVLGLTAITLISESLGSFGWFRLGPVIVACNAVGLAAWWLLGPIQGQPPEVTHSDHHSDQPSGIGRNPQTRVMIATVLIVFGSWTTRTVGALRSGMTSIDTLWYHLPAAVRFAQDGRLTGVPPQDADSITAFYPLTSSVFHAVGLLLFDSDLISVFVNLGWFAVVLLCAAQIGARFGVGPSAVLAVTILLGAPAFVETQSAGALTDVSGMALLLMAVAIMLGAPWGQLTLGRAVPVGLALGLATGMKFSFLFPAGAIALGSALSAPKCRRPLTAAVTAGAALVSGGYWFLRNIRATGSPLPTLALDIGPVRLPHVPSTLGLPLQAPIEVMDLGETWWEYLLPGLRDAFGPGWTVIVSLAFAGMAVGLLRRHDPQLRVLAVVAVASTVAFLYTPQYLLSGLYWATTLRYAFPGLALGLIVFTAIAPGRRTWLPYALAALAVVTQLDPVSWSVGFGGASFFPVASRADAVAGAAVATVAGVLIALSSWANRHHPAIASRHRIALVASALTASTLLLLHGPYHDRRYRNARPFPEGYAWAQGVANATIGVNGPLLSLKYPFAGADRSNKVQYLAVREPGGAIRDPANCREWRSLLTHSDLDYVVINATDQTIGPLRWTADIPGSQVVLSKANGPTSITIFALPDAIDSDNCP